MILKVIALAKPGTSLCQRQAAKASRASRRYWLFSSLVGEGGEDQQV